MSTSDTIIGPQTCASTKDYEITIGCLASALTVSFLVHGYYIGKAYIRWRRKRAYVLGRLRGERPWPRRRTAERGPFARFG